MTGLWNTVGHETEFESIGASAAFAEGLSAAFTMLAAVERQDLAGAEAARENALSLLRNSAQMFAQITDQAGDYLLFTNWSGPYRQELSDVLQRITGAGYSMPLRNSDLPAIAIKEVRDLAATIEAARFMGRHADWYPIRSITEAVTRATTLGVLVARISALHGGDPELSS